MSSIDVNKKNLLTAKQTLIEAHSSLSKNLPNLIQKALSCSGLRQDDKRVYDTRMVEDGETSREEVVHDRRSRASVYVTAAKGLYNAANTLSSSTIYNDITSVTSAIENILTYIDEFEFQPIKFNGETIATPEGAKRYSGTANTPSSYGGYQSKYGIYSVWGYTYSTDNIPTQAMRLMDIIIPGTGALVDGFYVASEYSDNFLVDTSTIGALIAISPSTITDLWNEYVETNLNGEYNYENFMPNGTIMQTALVGSDLSEHICSIIMQPEFLNLMQTATDIGQLGNYEDSQSNINSIGLALSIVGTDVATNNLLNPENFWWSEQPRNLDSKNKGESEDDSSSEKNYFLGLFATTGDNSSTNSISLEKSINRALNYVIGSSASESATSVIEGYVDLAPTINAAVNIGTTAGTNAKEILNKVEQSASSLKTTAQSLKPTLSTPSTSSSPTPTPTQTQTPTQSQPSTQTPVAEIPIELPKQVVEKIEVVTQSAPKLAASASAKVSEVINSGKEDIKVASAGVAAMTAGVGSAVANSVPKTVSTPIGDISLPALANNSSASGSIGVASSGGSGGSLTPYSEGSATDFIKNLTQDTTPSSSDSRVYDKNSFANSLEQTLHGENIGSGQVSNQTNNNNSSSTTTSNSANNLSTSANDATSTTNKTNNNVSSTSEKNTTTKNLSDNSNTSSQSKNEQKLGKGKTNSSGSSNDDTDDKEKKELSDTKEEEKAKEQEREQEEKNKNKEELTGDEVLQGSRKAYLTGKDRTISKVAVGVTVGEVILSALLKALKIINLIAFILLIIAIILLYTTYRVTHHKIIEKRKKQYLLSLEKIKDEKQVIDKVEQDTESNSLEQSNIEEQKVESSTIIEPIKNEENNNLDTPEEIKEDLIIPPMKDNPNYEEFGTGLDFMNQTTDDNNNQQ